MGKKKVTKTKLSPSPQKLPKVARTPEVSKVTKNRPLDNDEYPSWQFAIMDQDGPFGWSEVKAKTYRDILSKLRALEGQTWQTIVGSSNGKHHLIERSKLSPEAQKRLEKIKQDDIDHLFSIRLSGKERLFGITDSSTFKLLWWDPKHLVCPSKKKHT